jgi:hypothetical protein
MQEIIVIAVAFVVVVDYGDEVSDLGFFSGEREVRVGHFLSELRDVDGFMLVVETEVGEPEFHGGELIVGELVEIGSLAVDAA